MKKSKKLIIVFLSLLLVILIGITIMYVYNLSNTKNKEIAINNAEEQENIEDTNFIQNVLEENTLSNTEIIEQNTIKTEEKNVVNTKESKTDNVTKKEQKKTTKNKSTQTTTPQESAVAQPVTISKPIEEPKKENSKPVQEVQTPPVQETVVTPIVPTEEYKYNDSMTQTIINIINSNPSQYMQTDGYNVIVDSSITALTNQFTFTEERVKNKIANKAGTIKVYAQDYYYNGELLFTECYIF